MEGSASTPLQNNIHNDSDAEGDPSTSASTSKKSKKKKSKTKSSVSVPSADPTPSSSTSTPTSNPLRSLISGKGKYSPHLLSTVQQHLATEDPSGEYANLDKKEIVKLLDALKVRDVLEGKSGIGGRGKKDMSDYKFWSTQPVPTLGSTSGEFEEGPIEAPKPLSSLRSTPYALPKDFTWVTMDLEDATELKEVYELLTNNYVEDEDATFRFDYSADFLSWVLKPPGWKKDWHIGVRVQKTQKLVAFISGIPMDLRVRQSTRHASEINFLCVHKKLRSKRLAPVLIKEVTRRCNIEGVFQAIYTAGVFLPTPISMCRYYHRTLNPRKLVDTGFTSLPSSMTLARLIARSALPDSPRLAGFREVEERDLDGVGRLVERFMGRYQISQAWTEEEVRHMFWSGRGRGELVMEGKGKGRREGQVTWCFVVEDPTTHLITDFISFYTLPSTAMKTTPHQSLEAAYLFYYATTATPATAPLGVVGGTGEGGESVRDGERQGRTWDTETKEERRVLKDRLNELVKDALIVAKGAGFDVFNCLTLMDNTLFIEDQKFGAGDGFLHYYLYNWKVHTIAGGCMGGKAQESFVDGSDATLLRTDGSGVGVVMK